MAALADTLISMPPPLRIYADFNSVYGDNGSICWCLRYGTQLQPLDDLAEKLELRNGMPVILYYEDETEEFEVSAVLLKQPESNGPQWHARADWKTRRQIRG
jgi:hypothetical protein